MKLSKIYYILLAQLLLAVTSCDLEVENLNAPDRDRVLSSPEEVNELLKSTTTGFFAGLINWNNNYYDYLADQQITCSLSRPWPFNREPRERLTNEPGGTFESVFYNDWQNAYRAISAANDALEQVEGWSTQPEAFKNKVKAAAITLKGVAMGYIGLIYKEGIVLETNIPTNEMVFSNYNDIINKSVDYLETAKTFYTQNGDLEWDYISGFNLSADKTVQLINTYAAKFLLGKARNHQEFKSLDFGKIQGYLDNALEETLTGPGSVEIYNSYQYYACRERRNQFSYAADQKIPWLLSGKTAPTKKGTADSTPITSIDKRAELYFQYQEITRFRYSERDPTLYSNYASVRYAPVPKDRYDYPANILYLEEVLLLKAEVAYGMGDFAKAQDILNSSKRVTLGEMPLLTGANQNAIADALFYENSIELHLAGKAINWMFMRRWNLLQEGTMLHFPVPGLEAQLLGVAFETIGGAGTGDGIDAAKGETSWR